MIPALPLAYASQHIYDDRTPYAPVRTSAEPVVTRRRRRRGLTLTWRSRRAATGLARHSPATGR